MMFNRTRLSLDLCQRCIDFCSVGSVRWNSNRAVITRIHRSHYPRAYPTMIVNPDGSTYTIRYREPRRIITLPENIDTLSEEQRQLKLAKRKPKQKIIIEEDIEDSFDVGEYSHLWKK